MATNSVRVLAILAVLVLGTAAFAQERVVARFEGTGWTDDVGPFAVNDHWEVRWIANQSDGLFALSYFAPAEPFTRLISHAHQTVPGSGSSYVAKGGTFQYTVSATGAWEFEIVQLDPASFPTLNRTGLTFNGAGTTLIRAFTAEGPWEITWDREIVTGSTDNFIAIHEVDDALTALTPPAGDLFAPNLVYNLYSVGSPPRIVHPHAGTFYLETRMNTPWTFRVAALQ